METLRKIVLTQGVSGDERRVAEVIKQFIEPLTDECSYDAMGNLTAVKYGKNRGHKKIMLCAHMDEIGMLVTYIEKNGLIRFAPIGFINYLSACFSGVTSSRGVKGVLVPEGKVKPEEVTYDKCYIDIGADSRRAAERRVKVGDFFAVNPTLTRLSGKRICGRPLDDRVGCAIMIDIARELSGKEIDADIYYTFSVQEEVGCRGARPASFAIAPDLALVFDVTMTGDVPGSKMPAIKLSGGTAIKIKDASVICHAETVEQLIELAKREKIKYQCEILTSGGTDTSSIQMNGMGCCAAALSIPTRYIHSGVEMIDEEDVEATVKLAVAFIEEQK